MKKNSLRPYSSILVDGPDRAPSRAMLYPVGFKAEDFSKPIIGITSNWTNNWLKSFFPRSFQM